MKDKKSYIGRQKWSDKELQEFTHQLIQVIQWTEHLALGFDHSVGLYGTLFRQTNPVINGATLYHFEDDYTTWNFDVYEQGIFDKLILAAINARDEYGNLDLRKLDDWGRIICFQGVFTTHDGVAIAESSGFLDESDVPPIDTWFYVKNNYYHEHYEHTCQTLFCWIPKPFEEVMQNGIDVEMMGSYDWLDEYDPTLHQFLKSDLFNL